MDYAVLNNELTVDPLSRGYSGMTDAEAATDLNTEYRDRNVTSMSATDIFQNVDETEYAALTDAQRQAFWGMMGMGTLNPWGQEAAIFTDLFGGISATITALAAARVETVSRAVELGLGIVTEGDVAKARVYGSV